VSHEPKGEAKGTLKKIFEDWGWMPDFSSGVIMEIEEKDDETYAKVYYIDTNLKKPSPSIDWYPLRQLRSLHERR
tara:strand:- start:1701 stop:1925 length:225 start_codon:yes stop_codon:yes gene_type:complete